jgi:hypothetical protein
MSWFNQLGGILEQYSGASAAQAPDTVDNDFDEIAQVAPRSAIADGLAEAFRSEQTPEFGQMAAQMFGQSNGNQRASILNTLIATLGPTLIAQFLGRKGGSGSGGLGGLLEGLTGGGNQQITPEQAEQIPPEAVQDLATEAEKQDPSIIDQFSDFYAQHPTLIKTLGGAALAIALAKIAQRQGGR